MKNLGNMDKEKARAIQSLGGKASVKRRRHLKEMRTFACDYLGIRYYMDELLFGTKYTELNNKQKDILKAEIIVYLTKEGYIRLPSQDNEIVKAYKLYEYINSMSMEKTDYYFKRYRGNGKRKPYKPRTKG